MASYSIVLFISCIVGSIVSALGLFSSRERLLQMSDLIGTSHPILARLICGIAFVVCNALWIGAVSYLVYKSI